MCGGQQPRTAAPVAAVAGGTHQHHSPSCRTVAGRRCAGRRCSVAAWAVGREEKGRGRARDGRSGAWERCSPAICVAHQRPRLAWQAEPNSEGGSANVWLSQCAQVGTELTADQSEQEHANNELRSHLERLELGRLEEVVQWVGEARGSSAAPASGTAQRAYRTEADVLEHHTSSSHSIQCTVDQTDGICRAAQVQRVSESPLPRPPKASAHSHGKRSLAVAARMVGCLARLCACGDRCG